MLLLGLGRANLFCASPRTAVPCSPAELLFQCPRFATRTDMALLPCTGAAADLAFLSIHSALGAGTFLLFGAIAAAGGVYCWAALPETKGRSLAEVQALLSVDRQPSAASDGLAVHSGGPAPYPALLSAGAACPSAKFLCLHAAVPWDEAANRAWLQVKLGDRCADVSGGLGCRSRRRGRSSLLKRSRRGRAARRLARAYPPVVW